ncbi:MAG: glycosyltransferase family 4 protein [Gemmataceae bacterium]|nr:glycosyltransferase family 4 protein [Gemmataceae bacterium]
MMSQSVSTHNPTLSVSRWLRKLGRLPMRLRERTLGVMNPHHFDLFDLKTLNPFLVKRDCRPLEANPYDAETDLIGAVRYVCSLLATDPKLRRRFPTALSDGAGGAFAKSLIENPKLSASARANIRSAFESDPSARVRRVFEFREDLRAICPLGLTPKDRGDFLSWLITYGLADFQHTPEAAIWFHFELDEDPSRGLAASYRLHPEWQAAVPHGLTRFGWDELKQWVRTKYDFDARWLRRAILPEQFRPCDELKLLAVRHPAFKSQAMDDPDHTIAWAKSRPEIAKYADAKWYAGLAEDIRGGIASRPAANVIGLFRYTSGLQQAVKSAVDSLTRNDVRTELRDFPVLFLREPRNRDRFDAIELHDVTIVNTGIDLSIADAYRKSGLHPRAGVHRIGIWWWELEDLPAKWHDRSEGVDEIWAPTRFIARAMSKAFSKPVYTMNPGVELPSFETLGKSYFGLSDSKFTFGFVFDMNSRMQRKNPLGLIEAFRLAFRPDDAVELAIKVSPPESYYQDQWSRLREAIASTPNATLIDRVLTRSELLAFLDSTDCGVSLHRSEGFGLTCAESMLLGKPVIATGYSGNLDFMTSENSYLVDYRLVELTEDIDPYPKGSVWAEPSVEHTAELMRRVFENREEARRKGERAKLELRESLSIKAAGARMRSRLEAIATSRRG